MPDQEVTEPDPWSDSELFATASEFAGVGSDIDLPEVDRFRAAISRLVAKVIDNERRPVPTARPSVFLLEPAGPPERLRENSTRVPMLDQGREPLDRRVWFVTHVGNLGYWVPADFDSDDGLFRFVTDEVGMGAVPAILYDPRPPGSQLRYYPSGLDEPDSCEELPLAHSEVALDKVFEKIDLVYKNQLVTPGAQPRVTRLWADSSRGTAVRDAEALLSAVLQGALQTAFPTCKVRVEQPQPTGRVDIEIEERIPERRGAVTRHAILELKVLRGKHPNGSNVSGRKTREAVEEGLYQAAAYREDKDVLAAALCCFDMRREYTDRQCFAHVVDAASEMDVELEVWHLFHSSGAYRRHLARTGALSRRPTTAGTLT